MDLLESYIDYLNYEPLNEISKIGEFSKNQIDKLVNACRKNLKTAMKVLMDYGVDVEEMKKDAKQLSKSLTRGNKDLSKEISKGVLRAYEKQREGIEKKINDKDMKLRTKIAISISLLFSVIFVSILMMFICTSFFISIGLPKMFIILFPMIVLAPVIEEYGKRFSIIGKYPWVYTGIFSGFEAILYLVKLINMGYSIPLSVIYRTLPIIMHFLTTYIQKTIGEREIKEKGIKLEDISYKGYSLGVIIHSVYNSLGILFEYFLKLS